MRRFITQLLDSRIWIALSLACALFAVYESASKLLGGQEIEGVLDIVLLAVFLVNFVNRFKIVSGYVDKLKS